MTVPVKVEFLARNSRLAVGLMMKVNFDRYSLHHYYYDQIDVLRNLLVNDSPE